MNSREKLFELAKSARNNAYAPYSKLYVGAAILSSEGNYYSGCNVENVSYPEGSCAETGAIGQMISNGDNKIQEILIIADSKNLITPCGGCLQRIKEFSDENTLVHLANMREIEKTYKITELLPLAFGSIESSGVDNA